MNPVVQFDRIQALLAAYFWKCKRAGGVSLQPHIVQEIRDRLRQIAFLYDRICQRADQLLEDGRASKADDADAGVVLVFTYFTEPPEPPRIDGVSLRMPFKPVDELKLDAEAFYFVAHRLLAILEQCRHLLPGMPPIDCLPIRRVRNNLIEHAHRKDGAFEVSVSVSRAAGVRLRSAYEVDSTIGYVDEGIHANLQALLAVLDAGFAAAFAA